jgi:hypothetical protein
MRSSLFWDVTRRRLVVTDVSGQPIDPIFKAQAVFLDCLNVEDETDWLSRNVSKYLRKCSTLQDGTDSLFRNVGK